MLITLKSESKVEQHVNSLLVKFQLDIINSQIEIYTRYRKTSR